MGNRCSGRYSLALKVCEVFGTNGDERPERPANPKAAVVAGPLVNLSHPLLTADHV